MTAEAPDAGCEIKSRAMILHGDGLGRTAAEADAAADAPVGDQLRPGGQQPVGRPPHKPRRTAAQQVGSTALGDLIIGNSEGFVLVSHQIDVAKALGADPTRLSAVLVTHEHTDHVSGLATLTKQLGVPVYATAPTLDRLERKVPALARLGRALEAGTGFQLGELWVESFSTPHDAAGSVGYAVTGGGARMALATDLGHLTPQVWDAAQGADLLVCETNHDEDWVRSGPYPYALKQRILGDFGHLSNEAGAELAGRAALAGTRTILLAHLSSENNTPARAREVVSRRLSALGVRPEEDITLAVAPRSECGALYRLERGGALRAFPAREASLC